MTLPAIFTSFAAFVLIYSLFMAVRPNKETIEEKVKRLTAEKQAAGISESGKKEFSWKDLLAGLSRYTPRKWSERLDQELQSSGISLSGGEYLIMQIFLIILFSLLALILIPVNPVFLLLPLVSLALPRLYVVRARNKRIRQFNNQLADVLLTLANSLKAGFSLFQAMEMAGQEMPDPISSELKTTLKEMAFGASTDIALTNLCKRVNSRDLELVVTAILIQRLIGGNLAEILLSIHETIQERLRIQGEVKSLTAQGRLSGYIIGALPLLLALVITILQPAYLLPLFQRPLGLAMIGFGLVSQGIGFLLIKKIVTIKF